MSRSNMSATSSATSSSNGARARSTISRSCRPAPASATRSISNISRTASGPRPRSAPADRRVAGSDRRAGGGAGSPSIGAAGDDRRAPAAEIAYPDTLVGTDSHTTMVNGLGVLGWGVGGIEAEAAMLGQPVSMLIPEVVGFRLTGELKEGITATDLVLTVTQMLRGKGVVGRFVEFFGPGVSALSLADRATIANMAPEYGATCGFFRIDDKTLDYMRLTGRPEAEIALIEAYCKAQGLWLDPDAPDPVFTDTLSSTCRPSSRRSPGRSGRRTRSCSPGSTTSSSPISRRNSARTSAS